MTYESQDHAEPCWCEKATIFGIANLPDLKERQSSARVSPVEHQYLSEGRRVQLCSLKKLHRNIARDDANSILVCVFEELAVITLLFSREIE